MATPGEQFWWLGSVLSAASLLAILWFQWWRPAVAKWRLRKGFDLYFTVAPDSFDIFREHHVPPHQEVSVQLRMNPRLEFRQRELVFGFDGDRALLPEIVKSQNKF